MTLLQRLCRRFARTSFPMPIVVGAPRSGTTLLRMMLDSHPKLAMPPETGFLMLAGDFSADSGDLRQTFLQKVTHFPPDAPNWQDFGITLDTFQARLADINPFTVAEGYRVFYRLYAERFGKLRWGDKTPVYVRHMGAISAILPEARFIHIIRDGRDVALSWRDLWFSPGRDIETLAAQWKVEVLAGRKWGQGNPNYMEVSYEQLVTDPESVLRKICAFTQLSYAPEMLDYHNRANERLQEAKTRYRTDGTVVATHENRVQAVRLTKEPPDLSRIFVWKREMSAEECAQYAMVAGDLLAELGYETCP